VQGVDLQRFRSVFQHFDVNGDGQLEAPEREALLKFLRARNPEPGDRLTTGSRGPLLR